ncbi:MAG: hypothetical protein DWQ02_08660 [Bacteroidetes bacterium]|nr:MAG: hypothetical protein DWQ02_08660 [Bacteroidota bacterium]
MFFYHRAYREVTKGTEEQNSSINPPGISCALDIKSPSGFHYAQFEPLEQFEPSPVEVPINLVPIF